MYAGAMFSCFTRDSLGPSSPIHSLTRTRLIEVKVKDDVLPRGDDASVHVPRERRGFRVELHDARRDVHGQFLTRHRDGRPGLSRQNHRRADDDVAGDGARARRPWPRVVDSDGRVGEIRRSVPGGVVHLGKRVSHRAPSLAAPTRPHGNPVRPVAAIFRVTVVSKRPRERASTDDVARIFELRRRAPRVANGLSANDVRPPHPAARETASCARGRNSVCKHSARRL